MKPVIQEQCGIGASVRERALCKKRSVTAFVLGGLTLLSWVVIVLVTMWFVTEIGSVPDSLTAVLGVFYWAFVLWLIAGFGTITATVGGVFAFRALRLARHSGLRISLIVVFVLQVISALLATTLFACLCAVFVPML